MSSIASLRPMYVRSFASHCGVSKLQLHGFGLARTQRPRPSSRSSVMASATKSVLVPVGNGTEEMEAVITIDVLRRAGADVTVASVENDIQGGMPGAERLRDSEPLNQLVVEQNSAGRLYAAICATPAVFFEPKGLLAGKKATCHPAFTTKLSDQSVAETRVVVDGNLTTSRGPGTAFEFALSLVQQLYGEDTEKSVAGPMVMP